MKLIRSYLLFIPLLYRIVILFVIPAAVLILFLCLRIDTIIGTAVSVLILCCVEIIADYWAFGGICTKEFPGLEFLKSSVRGRKVFRYAVTGDCVRKLIWCLILVAGSEMISDRGNGKMDLLTQMIVCFGSSLLCYGTILLFQFIARHFINIALIMLISYVSAVLGTLLTVAAIAWSPAAMLFVGVAMAILLTAFTIWDLNRKMEGSYYDRTM